VDPSLALELACSAPTLPSRLALALVLVLLSVFQTLASVLHSLLAMVVLIAKLDTLLRSLSRFASSVWFTSRSLLDTISWNDLSNMTFRPGLCPFGLLLAFHIYGCPIGSITSTKVTMALFVTFVFPRKTFLRRRCTVFPFCFTQHLLQQPIHNSVILH